MPVCRGIDQRFQHGGGVGRQNGPRTAPRVRVAARTRPQCGEQTDLERSGNTHGMFQPRGIGRRPEVRCCRLQRYRARQRDGIHAAIAEPPVNDHRQFRCQDRLAPCNRCLGDVSRADRTGPARRKPGHILGTVERAAGILRIGPRLQPPPADIGIERLRPHTEQADRLLRTDPRHASSIY